MLFCAAVRSVSALPSDAVKNLAENAFKKKNPQEIISVFEQEISKLTQPDSKAEALVLLAQYEEHIGSNRSAARRYKQAAALDLSKELRSSLLLNAVRALLHTGEVKEARQLLSGISGGLSGGIQNPLYRMGAVYEAWLLLAENRFDEALVLIKRYAASGLFTNYQKALLFTLWWVDTDTSAKNELLKMYPSSPEAAAVRGEITVLPGTFWYLLPRINETADMPQTADINAPHTQQEKAAQPLYYQLGFYKTKKYADRLSRKLKKDGFDARITTEKRASGTVYFIVYVEEDSSGNMAIRLKDAEYEASPVFSR